MKNIFILFLIAIIAATIGFAVYTQNPRTQTTQTNTQPSDTIQIITTNQVLQDIAGWVAGETATVTSVAGLGIDAHDFEPTPKDIAAIQKADLFIMNGANLEPWAEKLIPELEQNGIPVLNMADTVALRQDDPHIWLSLRLMQTQVTALEKTLTGINPAAAETYISQAAELNELLQSLDKEYAFKLSPSFCETRDIVVTHDAFSYLAADYDITLHPISGLSPEAEPSSAHLAELTELIKNKQLQYIFFETLTSPKLAETIAKETGAQTLVLNPIEGFVDETEQRERGYLGLMRDNLAQLQTGMGCVQ